ncbi:MAG: hypothetical protein BWY80_00386 [Firmicutes bacterium ADurb.Bin456]|nr:MAG: hypothetical protein BWY80_00386 [Firmicutes bacterium ADurb.Bin456]
MSRLTRKSWTGACVIRNFQLTNGLDKNRSPLIRGFYREAVRTTHRGWDEPPGGGRELNMGREITLAVKTYHRTG